ncbi:winged helix-turn-helix transcriptional regulator [Micromonospora sp. WMMD1128]|uniref:winged helix-turn-helix transcriptional regulator n=1 Tax=unclassified Micromonospora TaxID=2617518 RepID=UPI00248CA9B2|nr:MULTISPECIES: winged helix-turn-helix transcriptional regulator [unclassified Micromonospora]WBB75826.1 winged helix-turn-helix transcriptional regulator [Micromonospora sp. WMMD1128]WFE36384.1 winged helix-turn-helix transcriptional regulator [Micromonospora sp. WMMD975]
METSSAGGKRAYHQYCGLASALDVLGERWTLLIVRELLMGPRRYGELLGDLPGVGTNLLAERLRFLTERGVVRQTDLRGTGSRLAYELTEVGQRLRPMVLGLAHWGMEFVGELSDGDTVRPHWGFLAVEAMIRPDHAPDVDEDYQFRVDGESFHLAVRGGQARPVRGEAERPAMLATTDAATFVQIGSGRLTPLLAMIQGRLKLEGDTEAVLRCCDLLGLEAGPVAAPRAAATRAAAPRR